MINLTQNVVFQPPRDNFYLQKGIAWQGETITSDIAGFKYGKNYKNFLAFDHLEWAKDNFGEYNVPKIVGITIYYVKPYDYFKGFSLYYQGIGFVETPELHQVNEDKQEQMGRITYLFADDEYITDILYQLIVGNQVINFAVETNKGKIYGIPGKHDRNTPGKMKSLLGQTASRDKVAIIALGGQYNPKTYFSNVFASYVKLRYLEDD